MLRKLLFRWGIASHSKERLNVSSSTAGSRGGKTASLASPEPSSCSSSPETCSFSSGSSFADNKNDGRQKMRTQSSSNKKRNHEEQVNGFACSSPISSSSSNGKQFREVETQTDHFHSPILLKGMSAFCPFNMQIQGLIICRNNQHHNSAAGATSASSCCSSPLYSPTAASVVPHYLHPNQMSSTCCFDSSVCGSSVRIPATRFLCFGPCLAPPPIHGHHLQPMTSQQHQHQNEQRFGLGVDSYSRRQATGRSRGEVGSLFHSIAE